MTIGLDELTNADPRVFTGLADRWDRLADTVAAHHRDWQSQVHGGALDQSWHGPAGDAARRQLDQVERRFAGHETELRRVSATLRQSAANFTEAQAQVATLRQQAARLGLVIDRTGAVSLDPGRLVADVTDLRGSTAAAEIIGKALMGVLASANDADRRAASALNSLTPHDTPPAGAAAAGAKPADGWPFPLPSGVIPPGAPGPGSDPAAIKKWWDSLPESTRKADADKYPNYVGGMDGIPDAVRDYANRKVLDDLINTTTDQQKRAALEELRSKLTPLPRNTRDYDADGFPETDVPAETRGTFLLGVDTATTGHVILATNNPDAAHNVVTWVPGVGTRLDGTNVGYATGIPASIAKQAGGNTSVIAWMNYDAPAGLDGDAVSTKDAVNGAPALVRFEQGLSTTHAPTVPMHNVLLGHSYGSSVIGEAAKIAGPGGLSGLHIDDVIAIGSPGMDVPSAAALGMPAGHVFASRAVYDPITLAPDGGVLDPHGPAPTTGGFGATVFDSGTGGNPGNAHGSYFNDGPGLTNIGHIVAGDYRAVTVPSAAELAAEAIEDGTVGGILGTIPIL